MLLLLLPESVDNLTTSCHPGQASCKTKAAHRHTRPLTNMDIQMALHSQLNPMGFSLALLGLAESLFCTNLLSMYGFISLLSAGSEPADRIPARALKPSRNGSTEKQSEEMPNSSARARLSLAWMAGRSCCILSSSIQCCCHVFASSFPSRPSLIHTPQVPLFSLPLPREVKGGCWRPVLKQALCHRDGAGCLGFFVVSS